MFNPLITSNRTIPRSSCGQKLDDGTVLLLGLTGSCPCSSLYNFLVCILCIFMNITTSYIITFDCQSRLFSLLNIHCSSDCICSCCALSITLCPFLDVQIVQLQLLEAMINCYVIDCGSELDVYSLVTVKLCYSSTSYTITGPVYKNPQAQQWQYQLILMQAQA